MRYGLETRTAPTTEPVDTADAKQHLRVDTSDDDTYIDGLVMAARMRVEEYLQRALITTEYTMKVDLFSADVIFLPRSPVQSVDEIRYIDDGGVQQTLAPSKYRADLTSTTPRITAAYSETWPTTRPIMNAIEVDFTAGYGDSASDVPEPIRQAIRILVGTWYDDGRSAIQIGSVASALPKTADYLLGPYRTGFQYGV